jgi:hypothetical protein
MGKSYLFECAHCGYRAAVSGRADAGHEVRVQTARCKDCRTLFDAVVALRSQERLTSLPGLRRTLRHSAEPPPSLAAALNQLPRPATTRHRWHTYELACPNDPNHRVEPWNAPGRCPRCGDYLEPSALPYRRWD